MRIRKSVLIISMLIIICTIVCIIHQIMLESVRNIKTDFFNVVSDKTDQGIDYGSLIRYDYTRYFEIKTVDSLELKIDSVFHDFKKSYMNVRYSFDINKNDENHSVGAAGVESKWYIKKIGNRWIVYDVDESP